VSKGATCGKSTIAPAHTPTPLLTRGFLPLSPLALTDENRVVFYEKRHQTISRHQRDPKEEGGTLTQVGGAFV
jgi:hypothetical protein